MSDPISSTRDEYNYWPQQPWEDPATHDAIVRSADNLPTGMCVAPKSVPEAAFCGDDLALSNACRRAPEGSFDHLLCDDLALHSAQDFARDVATKAAEFFVSGSVGKSK